MRSVQPRRNLALSCVTRIVTFRRMNAEREIFDRLDADGADLRADADADADASAGRVVAHAEIAAWLATWGTPDEVPAPDEWLK